MGSRGCYENCAYCCITTLHNLAPGKKFRQRSMDFIADEMAELYREPGTRQFVFHDDNFLAPSVAHNQVRIEGFDKAFKSRGMEDILAPSGAFHPDSAPACFLRAGGISRWLGTFKREWQFSSSAAVEYD